MTDAVIFPSVSTDPNWMDNPLRGCRGQSTNRWFPVDVDSQGNEHEPSYAPPDVKEICDRCPVRTECLAWALNSDQMAGIWGGYTTYERQLMKKPKQRKHCLGCGSDEVVTESSHEICLACGISWPIW